MPHKRNTGEKILECLCWGVGGKAAILGRWAG